MFWNHLRNACIAALTLAAPGQAAHAGSYPERPVALIVPGPAGGTPDAVARLIGESLRARLGQQVVVDNRAGANGFIGVQAAARAQPDGYTLLMGFAQTMALNPATFKRIPYDPLRDFAPVARLVEFELVLAVPASLPVKTVADLVGWLRTNKGKAAFGSFGSGSPSQFAGEMFARSSGTDAQHVAYKGSAPLVTDLVGGQVQYSFVVLQVAQQLARAGKVRLLAVTGSARQAAAPELPTMAEAGYGDVVATGWYGIYAPKGTPEAILQRLEHEIGVVMERPDLQRRLAEQGVRPAFSGRAAFQAYAQSEIDRWRAIVQKTGFTAQD
ncbi:Bug family tripartite tricarboxylate transporter substrate binding protein [Cupriavidus consociatus]|uniref:Bug family tripartite tricarboxylate transporter substrate binding protein n=1 Tax=Cupriavidus consociatus TaxID=2821357 RepID=UPI001AE1A838|nr:MULTISPECIES: tripartite tricarboxylate transporter substrate binding protein [unclassified Cupriavidus]MBP0624460.1 tripartite tricarboxylate transporter substrate binding protein [Cupriavidus sp. LEh25]MDK2661171.1 tripartite tricarboxylate transporter substrate binding protein [Cupriavidus sp. LEh21]